MRTFGVLIYILFFLSSHGFSQGLFESTETNTQSGENKNLTLGGYVRGSLYGGSDNYDFTSVFGEIGINTEYSPGRAYLFADVRIREGIRFNESNVAVQLKEAYAGYQSEKFDLYLGNQIVSWGRTDGFNPTNNINPNDYFFLSARPDDQKLANFMLRAKYRPSPLFDIEVIGIPFFRPSVYRYDLFKIAEGVSFDEGAIPGKKVENSTIAARINFDLSSAGFSLSWFHGYDPFYGFDVKSIDLSQLNHPVVVYHPDYYQKDAIGADFAIPVRSLIMRGELAYNQTYFYNKHMYIPNPDLAWVFGLEYEFIDITAIIQYVGKYTFEYQDLEKPVLNDPMDIDQLIQYATDNIGRESELFNRKVFLQEKQTNHALFLTLARSFMYSTIMTEITGYYNLTSDDYFIRPGITWNINDALSTGLGANIMIGPENSIFDYASDILNGVFGELRVTF